MMMNNPIQLLVQTIRTGGNPNAVLQNMAAGDPRIGQAMQMMQGKSPQQLRNMAENMARERGINIADVARGLGIPLK